MVPLWTQFIPEQMAGLKFWVCCALSIDESTVSTHKISVSTLIGTVLVSTWYCALVHLNLFNWQQPTIISQYCNKWGPTWPLSSRYFVRWSQVTTWILLGSRCGNDHGSRRERPVVVCSSKLYWAEVLNWSTQFKWAELSWREMKRSDYGESRCQLNTAQVALWDSSLIE